ncbi:unnamed protein product, partial [Vitis vinifera]
MEVVGELLLSAALQVLFDKLASSDFLSFARQEHIHSQLKKWETQLFNIREVLNDAEDKQNESTSVKLWLAELRILAYDMEDILDEFNTEMLRRKLAVQPQAAAASTSKIKDITSRLEDISTRKAELRLKKVAGTTTTWKRTPTTSLFNEPQVHGRDDDKNKMVDLLLSDESAVVPIVGMGGLGKTTLARLAYNDDAVVKHFSPRAWVCVSVESDVEKITKAILSDISPQSSDSNNFNRLQVELSQSLAGKRFLLVLDDVWNMNYDNWNDLRSPFRGGAKGSDDCWSIFVQHAFENRDIQKHPNLKSIGKKIVEKCFVYCATFPQDYEFRETELVLLWMAEGLIQPLEGNKQMEDLGAEYFRELVSRSFFQQSGNGGSQFVMHDLISDLAQSVAAQLCFNLEDKLEHNKNHIISRDTRHKLRTFIALPIYVGPFFGPCHLTNLKHLRYLNFSNTFIERLPESISELYNLQALILCQCRYLAINLVNLQTLSKFMVEKNNSSSSIKELKKLSNIRGTLSILGLHNVADAQDAMDVDLKGKHNIKDLTMEWGYDFDDTRNEKNEMQVLELLQPHKNLEKLTISFYGGGIFPSWIGNPSFSLMVQLCLKGCRNCTLLPSLGQLSSLKNLRIQGMSGIKNIDVEFYGPNVESFQSLESLTFSDMPEWEEWRSPSFIDEERLFPRLRELKMMECPKLIPPLPKVLPLHELKLEACNEEVLEKLGGLKRLKVRGCDGLVSLEEPALPCSLEYLEIEGCENLEKLPNELQSLRSATELVIRECPKLMNILEKGWPPMLRELRVYDCKGIKALPGELPTSLKRLIIRFCENGCKGLKHHHLQNLTSLELLYIIGCPSLESLPEGGLGFAPNLRFVTINLESMASLPLPTLVSLERLYIRNCPKLQQFLPKEGLPATLGWLEIWGCPIIEKRCLKNGGEDWPHIAHIPVIDIGRN